MEEETSLGYSFQPGHEKKVRKGLNNGSLGPRADEALKILSLHMPEFLGGNPLTSAEMMGPRLGGAPPMPERPMPTMPPPPAVPSPVGQPPAGPVDFPNPSPSPAPPAPQAGPPPQGRPSVGGSPGRGLPTTMGGSESDQLKKMLETALGGGRPTPKFDPREEGGQGPMIPIGPPPSPTPQAGPAAPPVNSPRLPAGKPRGGLDALLSMILGG